MRFLMMSMILTILFFASTSAGHAKSMSELDIKGFEKKSDSKARAVVKSPFTPARTSPDELLIEDLFLSGIAVGAGRSFALISGYTVTEGDKIAGLRVRTIADNRVVLQYLDKVHTLYLDGGY